MEFENLVNEISQSDDSLRYMSELRQNEISIAKVSTDKLDYYIEALFNHLKEDDTKSALIIVQAFLFWKNNNAIAMMKRKGVFRCSKYKFKSITLIEVIRYCFTNKVFFKLDENNIDFLKSIMSLISISEEIEIYRSDVLKQLKDNGKYSPKTLLAIIESQFGYGRNLDGNGNISSELLSHYSNEDFAESVSYLISIFDEEIGLGSEHLNYIDPCVDKNDTYFQMIMSGCKIQQYIKAEILVNSFGYSASVVDASKVIIESPDYYLERSIRLGYIQTELQMRIRELNKEELKDKKILSLKQVVIGIFQGYPESFVKLNLKPIPRYTLQFLPIPDFLNVFSSDHMFLEEAHSLMLLGMDSYGDEELDKQLIFNNITVLDVLKIQRLFRFVNYMLSMALDSSPDFAENELLMLYSILPVMSHDNFKVMLGIILPQEKIDDCLKLLLSNVSSGDHFDIQYTPIVSMGEGIIMAPAILSGSNLVRNILCNHSLRPSLKDGLDPMQKDLSIELKKKGFQVEVECCLYGNSLETDILAAKDGYIFAIECKNSYHPCNVHEMRTSFEHIKKGIEQLEKRKYWLSKNENQKALFARLGWEYNDSKVITCIATANRVFNGYIKNDIYVRQSHELLNVLRTGVINTNLASYRVWKGDGFNTLDLVEYIQGHTTIKDHFDSLVDVERVYSFSGKSILFKTHELDLVNLSEITESRYTKIA